MINKKPPPSPTSSNAKPPKEAMLFEEKDMMELDISNIARALNHIFKRLVKVEILLQSASIAAALGTEKPNASPVVFTKEDEVLVKSFIMREFATVLTEVLKNSPDLLKGNNNAEEP